jgi:ubiquinone/menaquinone biosynthesis C-methylase UbiE
MDLQQQHGSTPAIFSSSCHENPNILKYALIKKGDTCIDLSCGKGSVPFALAQKAAHTGTVIGIDANDDNLAAARSELHEMQLASVRFIKAALTALPLADSSVNWVISSHMLHPAPHHDAVWEEINRVLRPDGSFVINDRYRLKRITAENPQTVPPAASAATAAVLTKSDYLTMLLDIGFQEIEVLYESQAYFLGASEVISFTLRGRKAKPGHMRGRLSEMIIG